jgi:protein ImuA
MMAPTIRPQILRDLQERIQEIEAGRQRVDGRRYVSTGFDQLDRILGNRGLRRGSLIEWAGAGETEGSGAATLALTVAAHLLRETGALIVIDDAREFYPPAAAQLGIPFDRTIIVQPDKSRSAFWAWEQALRCPGVAVTFGWIETIDDRMLRRLQLAAETGGGLGFLLRRGKRSGPSWAATRISVNGVCWRAGLRERPVIHGAKARGADATPLSTTYADSLARRLQVSLTRGKMIELELEHEASDVPLFSELADSAALGD